MKETMEVSDIQKKDREDIAFWEAVYQLRALRPGDSEAAHGQAEDILLQYLAAIGAKQLANEFEKARDRIGFWYA